MVSRSEDTRSSAFIEGDARSMALTTMEATITNRHTKELGERVQGELIHMVNDRQLN